METLSLEEFDAKWWHRIKEFMSITVEGEESDFFEFKNANTESLKTNCVESSDEEKEKILNDLENREENFNIRNYGTDNIKELSDTVLSMEQEPMLPDDINNFSCKNYGYDLKIDHTKVNKSDLIDFFQEFSLIDLNSFKDSEKSKSLPESAYIRELFQTTSTKRVKDYVFYMLNFKVDCVEYRVMKDFLMMCYLFKQIFGTSSNNSLSTSFKKLKFDYSMMYLRIGMLFPRSGTVLV